MSQTIADKIHRALLLMSQIELTHSLWHTPRLKVRKTTLQTKLKLYGGAAQILQRSRNHLKISGSRRVRRNTLHAEDAQILDIIVKKKKGCHGDQEPGISATLMDESNCCPIPLHKSVHNICKIPKILSRHHTPDILYSHLKFYKTMPQNQTETPLSCRNNTVQYVQENLTPS